MNNTVLVTGGCGYIGSHIAAELIKNHERVIIVDNLSHSNTSVLTGLQSITKQSICFYCCDINDVNQLSEIMRMEKVTEVIHCAALKSIPHSFSNPTLYYENNVCATVRLVKAMQKNHVKRIIFSSTASIYKDSDYPVNENSPIEIINPYAQTKKTCEEYLLNLYRSDKSWSICVFRYFNPIGAHKSALIGELPLGDADNILPLVMDTAMGIRDCFQILGNDYDTQDGTGIRDYIHVVDLAECHYRALQYLRGTSCFEIMNVGTGRGYSVLEVIHSFEQSLNIQIPTKICGRREGDVGVSFANCQKAETILHWTAQRSLDDMCRDAWNWHKMIRKS